MATNPSTIARPYPELTWVAIIVGWILGVIIAVSIGYAALILGFVNAVIRPVVLILTLPLTVLTLGLFLLVVNAGMVGLTAALLPGFQVAGFGTAVLASIVVSLTSWFASWTIGPRGRYEVMVIEGHPRQP